MGDPRQGRHACRESMLSVYRVCRHQKRWRRGCRSRSVRPGPRHLAYMPLGIGILFIGSGFIGNAFVLGPVAPRMPDRHPAQRVAVLADAQNLYHTAHSLHSRNIDYTTLLDDAIGDRALVRAIAYVVRADSPDEQTFFDALSDIGFETRIKDIRTYPDGTKRADWDVGLSLDAVTLANHVDTVVLCTGDGDFSRLCIHLRHAGVRTEVMCFSESTADSLIEAAHRFINLSEDPDRYLL